MIFSHIVCGIRRCGRSTHNEHSNFFRGFASPVIDKQVQLKRAERERRRQQLSAEFASTFADVAEKKRQLDRMSAAIADIEATRQRKSREFVHMQVGRLLVLEYAFTSFDVLMIHS